VKHCLASLLLTLCFVVPDRAGTIYENGPANGQVNAWPVGLGYFTSDTFTITGGSQLPTGLTFTAWLYPGDTLTSLEVSITSGINGGTTYFDQVVPVSASACFINQYGYNICSEIASFNGPALPTGTYWLNLQNANTTNGQQVGWDQNSGIGCHSPGCPSQGWESEAGPVPSESFSLLGNANGTVPEPSNLVMFGSGIISAAVLLRRKIGL
jgi:hypothetical protein